MGSDAPIPPTQHVGIAQDDGFRADANGHWKREHRDLRRIRVGTHDHYAEMAPYLVVARETHFRSLCLTGSDTWAKDAGILIEDLDANMISDFDVPVLGKPLPFRSF